MTRGRYLMIAGAVVVACVLVAVVFLMQSQGTDGCAPGDVADWLLKRQVGWDAVAESAFQDKPLDHILLIQAVRRDLEDLPRPACADDLYILTVFYDNLVDGDTFTIAGRDQDGYFCISPRQGTFQIHLRGENRPNRRQPTLDLRLKMAKMI